MQVRHGDIAPSAKSRPLGRFFCGRLEGFGDPSSYGVVVFKKTGEKGLTEGSCCLNKDK